MTRKTVPSVPAAFSAALAAGLALTAGVVAGPVAGAAPGPAGSLGSTQELLSTGHSSDPFGNEVPSAGSVSGSSRLDGSVTAGSMVVPLAAGGSLDAVLDPVPMTPRPAPDPSITTATVRSRTALRPTSTAPDDKRAERWTVTSAAMGRTVDLEVYRAPRGARAGVLYFLDGVESPDPSGWATRMGFDDPAIHQLPVNVVVPLGGESSMWSDWDADDPVLARNKWETFLATELPPLLEGTQASSAEHPPLAVNGHYGALGISMGAGAAAHLVSSRPDRFDAVGGVSGCYGNGDPLGRQFVEMTVGRNRGTVANLWGAPGSRSWVAHDTIAHPDGLRGKRVFMSAATGVVGPEDLAAFGGVPSVLLQGHVLEKASRESTQALDRALASRGIDHRVDYSALGIHNWPVFEPAIRSGAEYLVPALGPVTFPAAARVGETGAGPAGSTGSGPAGSTGS